MPNHQIPETINQTMQEALSQYVFPGGAVAVSKDGVLLFCDVFGLADITTREMVTLDTVFDLASLTKPLATTLAVMALVQDGCLSLNSRVGQLLPTFAETDKSPVTVAQLLSHTSGLPDYVPFYRDVNGASHAEKKAHLEMLLKNTPLGQPPGEKVCYSDPGFMILRRIIEKVIGERLDQYVARAVYHPMGIHEGLFFNDSDKSAFPARYAATEYCPFRGRLLKGEVHDENAHAAGGVEGHAGLFGTIFATHSLLARLMAIYRGQYEIPKISTHTLRRFLTPQGNTGRMLGFDMPAAEASSAGQYFSRNSAGHLGFTGTSFWMDLDRSVIVVLLTNRVHPTRENTGIRAFRPLLHDRIMAAVNG